MICFLRYKLDVGTKRAPFQNGIGHRQVCFALVVIEDDFSPWQVVTC